MQTKLFKFPSIGDQIHATMVDWSIKENERLGEDSVEYIKSPINYTGNKFRILNQIDKYFPRDVDVFVDLFCGGATVGFNVNAKKIILVDNNIFVIALLKHLASSDYLTLKRRLELLIAEYNLSYSAKHGYGYYREQGYVSGNNGLKEFNHDGFYNLRATFNRQKDKLTGHSLDMLYMLMVYGFNNDIRFNRNDEFNLPVGKTDLNKNNLQKLEQYIVRAKKIDYEFVCGDFRDKKIKKVLLKADFVYADPPYMITNAVYNESNKWGNQTERELLSLLQELDNHKVRFALSNVISKEGIINEPLEAWVKLGNIKCESINYHYRSSSYNKKNRWANEKEVLITNGHKRTFENPEQAIYWKQKEGFAPSI